MDSKHLDATGLPLEVGHKVAWGVGGRRSYGLALGVITALDIKPSKKWLGYKDGSAQYEPYDQPTITVKSLERGRLGKTITNTNSDGRFELVLITNQAFEGNV